jgi:threonine/homoserine/homoserine lactone efflux protein
MGAATHVAFSAIGISALVAASPVALAVLGWAGAAYIVWLGAGFLTTGATALPVAARERIAPVEAWRRGIATNLLNPKAYLFMLVVFPQFIRAGGWPAGLQALVLGALLLAIAVPIYGSLALAAARAGEALARRPEAGRIINRGAGLVLVALGLALAAGQAIEAWGGLE